MSYVSLEKYHFTHSEEEYEKEYDNRVRSSQTIQLPVV